MMSILHPVFLWIPMPFTLLRKIFADALSESPLTYSTKRTGVNHSLLLDFKDKLPIWQISKKRCFMKMCEKTWNYV